MDQRSSTQVDQLLHGFRQALQAGQYAVAMELASKANTISPFNPDVKQAIREVMLHRAGVKGSGNVSESPKPAPAMEIPPGQEPGAHPRARERDQVPPRGTMTRPTDASGGWELGLRQQAAPLGSRSGLHSLNSSGSTQGSGLRPFVPGADRRPSGPVGSDARLPRPTVEADSTPVSPILSDAGRAAADGMMLGWVAVKVAATQVSVWSSRITARGLMLTAGYVAAASFLIYAGMTANRTFGMAPFPPRAESAKVDEPRDPSRRLAQAIAGSMGGAIAVDPGTGASTTSPGRVIQSVTEVPDPSAVPAIPAPESVIASLPSLDTPGRTQSAPDTEKTRPISPKNLATEADDLLSRGKVEETIVLIESRLQSIPAVSRPGLQTILARARHMQGERFLNQGKFTDAIKSYEAAVELEPKDANYRLYLGNAFYHYATRLKDKQEQSLPRFREAASSVEQATKLAPNNFFAHHRLALIYEALKRPQDARKAWQAVIKHAPAGSQSAQAADRALKRLPRRG